MKNKFTRANITDVLLDVGKFFKNFMKLNIEKYIYREIKRSGIIPLPLYLSLHQTLFA
jgi:hypothetical protein